MAPDGSLAVQELIRERHCGRIERVALFLPYAHAVQKDEYDPPDGPLDGYDSLSCLPATPPPARAAARRVGRPPMDRLPPNAQIALVHDWLNQRGGAENVLETMHALFPQAPVYTSLYQPDLMPSRMRQWDIRSTWLGRVPGAQAWHRYLLPLYPHAFARLDLSGLDLVFSIKSAFCLGVRTRTAAQRAQHVCYCLTPTRFLWDFERYAQREALSPVARVLARVWLPRWRRWEIAAASRVDHFVAISRAVQQRIRDCYGRESEIIHPPVNTHEFPLSGPTDRDAPYLIVSRLVPYKRIDLAVDAFNRMPDRQLIIAGAGRDAPALQAKARANIAFTGYVPRARIASLVRACRAFVFPGEEDFGIAPVEAMSAGKPVIAFGAGGALDYVQEGETGVFFRERTPAALVDAVERAAARTWDAEACRRQAERFSADNFRRRIRACVLKRLGA